MHTMEKGRKITPWKMLENHIWNMIEWKMYTKEKGRKNTPWKMQEKSQLENDRMEYAHHGKWQKSHTL